VGLLDCDRKFCFPINLKLRLVVIIPVAVEKVFVDANGSIGSNVYMSKRSADALRYRYSRRLADYDGTTLPFRVAVLLLLH
jgi:hypothetical protein